MSSLRNSVCALTIFSALAAFGADEKPEVSLNGFFDTYYSYNFNHPSQVVPPTNTSVVTAGLPAANNTYRYYDTYHNQMTLSLAEFTLQAKLKEVSLLTDFDFGTFADLNSPVDEVSKHIGQAVLTYKPEGSAFVLDVGKMYSNAGFETVKSKDNFNYSRTLLFSYGMPFWHTGLHLGYDAVPGQLQTSLYIYNGWNSIYDNNESKTIGVQLKYTPNSDVTIVYNYIGGPERFNNESDLKSIHEINVNWNANDRWTLATDFLCGSEENVVVGADKKRMEWYGGVLYVKYVISDKSYLSPRFEVYRDQTGYTLGGGVQTVQSSTLTYGRTLAKGLEVRTEARVDQSTQSTFAANAGTFKDSQTTLLAALLFNF